MQENNQSHKEHPDKINLDFVINQVGNSPDFIVDLLQTFDSALSDFIQQLNSIMDSKDIALLPITVHKLKPSLKMFSLNTSLDHVYTIESEIYHQLDQKDLLELVDSLNKKLVLTKEQLIPIIGEYQEKS